MSYENILRDNQKILIAFMVYKVSLSIKLYSLKKVKDRQVSHVILFQVKQSSDTLSRKIFSYDIGPRIEHTFLIENRGWITLTNLSLILQLPYEIFDGYRLLYLSDQIREASHTNQTTVLKNILPSIIGSDGRQYGNCEIPKEFINPLELTLMDFKFIDDITRKSTYNSLVRIAKRFKRGIEELSESSLASLNKHKPIRDSEIGLTYNTLQRDYENRIILNCPHFRQSVNSTKDIRTIENKYLIKCINIQCQIKHFERGDTVRLKWIGWLWAETFFKLHKSDIQFVSRLHIDHWGDLPLIIKSYHDIQENLFRNKSHTMNEKFIDIKYPSNNYFELKQSIIFHSVQLKVTHKVPLWPIIAGIIVGLSILMILSALLYCGGFFTRRRKYSAIKAKKCLFSLENKHLDEKSHNNSNINSLFNWTTSQNSLIKTVENCSLLQSSDSQLPTSIKKHQFDFDYSEKTSPSNLNENLIVEQHSTDKNDEHVPNNKYQQSLLKILVKPNENDDCISPLLKPSNLSLYEQHKSQQLEVIEEDKESSTTIVDNN
ncbi:hypothetical protein MN116_003106 [Schistosoma mekongi]|uniref:Integrin alpha third immunoglobulin-like domain-containing protein n=1 Tax=Schistosoma mekongi TaxID=38744 RepID=A0AAE1ZIA3_SCHME|nr:hypothetical protein MN116_003106 [Schistosoma mekongi]